MSENKIFHYKCWGKDTHKFKFKLTWIDKLDFREKQQGLRQGLRLRRDDRELLLLDVDFRDADESGHRVQDQVLRCRWEGDGQNAIGKFTLGQMNGHQLRLKKGLVNRLKATHSIVSSQLWLFWICFCPNLVHFKTNNSAIFFWIRSWVRWLFHGQAWQN